MTRVNLVSSYGFYIFCKILVRGKFKPSAFMGKIGKIWELGDVVC